MKNFISSFLFAIPILLNVASAQNIAINGDGATPDASAMLDIASTAKGFLMPRMTTVQQNAITLPATGLLIFNTTDNTFKVNTGTPASPIWTALSASSNNWLLSGNTGTNGSTNFIGTNDNTKMNFRTNNQQRMVIDAQGRVGIGVTAPTNPLVVKDTFEIARTGSAVSQLLFSNTAGSGDFRIGGDGGDIFWQGGGGRNLQMGAYWAVVLGGDRQTASFPAYSPSIANTGVLVQAQRDASVPLAIESFSASQTANLTEWRNAAGTILNTVNKNGNLAIGASAFNGTNPEKLLVDAGTTSSVNAIVGKGNIDNYLQNNSNGTSASSDVVATANNGNETSNYVDMGINGGSNTSNIMGGANDSYLYNIGQNFLIAAGTAAKSLVFMTGGTSQATNERMRIDGSGNVGVGTTSPSYKLQVSAASNPLQLTGLQTGANTDSVLTVSNGVVRRLNFSALNISSNAWGLTGNASTNPSSNFIGTTDNQSLVFKANNQLSGKIDILANNTMFGYQAGQATNNGNNNTFIGYQSGSSNNNGQYNTSVGSTALSTTNTGVGNAALGYAALSSNLSGDYNTGFGNAAGATNSNGDNNTFIGNGADATSGNLINATAIGNNAKVASSNSMVLGGTGANAVNVAIGTNTFNGTNPEKLVVDAGTTTSVNAIVGKGSIDNYLQLNIQNNSSGASASSDVVATANNGNETSNYVDMGINGGSNTSNVMGGANDSYLYNIGQNFLIASGTAAKSLVFMTGGTSQAANERMRIDGSGNVGIGNTAPSQKLDITGNLKFSGALMPNNTAGTSGYFLQSNGAGTAPAWVDPATSVAASAWVQNGNNTASLKSLGTTSNFDLPFITNNTEKMRVSVSGDVAIGASTFNGTNPEQLLVDAGTTASVNAIVGKGSIDNYLQLNIQNNSTGANASSDVVATANNGSETNNFVDMGINSGNYSGGVMGGANDSYLLNQGQNFLIATGTAAKSLIFMTGGTSQVTNERMRIDGSGNVGVGTTTPTSTFQVRGSVANSIVTKTATYSATASDYTIVCNNSGAITINLPSASGASGRVYVIKKISAALNNVTIDGQGAETIDGAATKVLMNQYESVMIQCDGTGWYILSKN
jgi:hypothetical protein